MTLEVLPRLFPLLDGSRTAAGIAEELNGFLPEAKVMSVLSFLEQKGLVEQVEDIPAGLGAEDALALESVARFLGRRGTHYGALTALKKANIGLLGAGPVVPVLCSSLANLGVRRFTLAGADTLGPLDLQHSRFYRAEDIGRPLSDALRDRVLTQTPHVQLNVAGQLPDTVDAWTDALQGLDMFVVLLQGPVLFHPWLENLNLAALSLRIPWTSVALLDGDEMHIGPTILPRFTACYKCFEQRFRSNLIFQEVEQVFEKYVRERRERLDFGFMPPLSDIVGGLAAIEVVRTLDPDTGAATLGKLMTFNIRDYSVAYHPVLKLPRCPACSSATAGQPRQRVWS
jgi:bacteriocin biosynthesis cyclodehydratase domain-containing protein